MIEYSGVSNYNKSALYSFVDTSFQLTHSNPINSQTPQLTDLFIVGELAQSKFPVYLLESASTKTKYVMKLFPYKKGKPDNLFKNEAKNSFLIHPNIVRTRQVGFRYTLKIESTSSEISYTIQDYACHGDFFDLISGRRISCEEKLMRTYFHQLIEGMEYLHKNKVAHCDLKLENLLLNKDFNLQIADFDLSREINQLILKPSGSPVYRAPELKEGNCRNLAAVDIYAAGIILFTMKTHGALPYLEDPNKIPGYDLFLKLRDSPQEFWKFHCKMLGTRSEFFDEDFKDLFLSMTYFNPTQRYTIEDIKSSKWYNKEIYSLNQLKIIMQNSLLHKLA